MCIENKNVKKLLLLHQMIFKASENNGMIFLGEIYRVSDERVSVIIKVCRTLTMEEVSYILTLNFTLYYFRGEKIQAAKASYSSSCRFAATKRG